MTILADFIDSAYLKHRQQDLPPPGRCPVSCSPTTYPTGNTLTSSRRPHRPYTELEEELHETAHIDYDRVAIVCCLG
jgi:hypothetical protein